MRIHEILLEEEVVPYQSEPIYTGKISQLAELAKQNCSEFLENNLDSPLWRGSISSHTEARIIDPSSGVRKSENTSNHYTELMDNSPYYKGWPKRSKSLICSTSESRARQYGRLYAVLPFNGTKIAVASDFDIWLTSLYFPELNWATNLYKFNEFMGDSGLGFPENYEDMVWYSKSATFANIFRREFYDEKDNFKPSNFIEYIQKYMAPDLVEFTLEDTLSFSTTEHPNKECWFSGKCIIMEKDIYNSMLSALTK